MRRVLLKLSAVTAATVATASADLLSRSFGDFTAEHVASFYSDGIVCVPQFVPDAVTEYLKSSMVAQIHAEAESRRKDRHADPLSEFSTTGEQVFSERYFLESGDKVRYFLEPGMNEVSVSTINKIAHGLHTDNGVFQAFSANPAFGAIARKLGRQQPSVVQSMYILKAPRVGGPVVAHQDTTWIFSRPHSCLAMWVALDDCTVQNSCLLALKGSHRTHIPVSAQCTLDEGGLKTTIQGTLPNVALGDMEPLECPKGSLVVFDGATVHGSTGNESDMQRHAYVIHVVDDMCSWGPRNWFGKHLARLRI
jgi:phytanoyl-CoA hydroxylase